MPQGLLNILIDANIQPNNLKKPEANCWMQIDQATAFGENPLTN